MADKRNPMDDLIVRPNTRTMTLSEVLRRMGAFLRQIPSLEFVIICHRRGDPMDLLACTRFPDDKGLARQLLKNALNAYEREVLKFVNPS